GFDAERKGRYVQQDQVLHLAGEHGGLDGRADGHALIGVDPLVGFLADEVLDGLLDRRDAGRAADEDHLVDLVRLQPRVLKRLPRRPQGRFDQVPGQLFKLGPGKRHVDVQRPLRPHGDEGQADVGGGHARQLDLRLLGRLLEALHGLAVPGQIDAVLHLELFHKPADDALIEVVAAQVVVAAGGLDLKDPVADLKDRDVKRTAAQVEDEDGLVAFLVKAVGQGRGRRLVDDAQDFQARYGACVLRSLALGVGEIRGYSDDRLRDGLAQVVFGLGLELLQDHGRNLLGRVLLVVNADLVVGAHLAL